MAFNNAAASFAFGPSNCARSSATRAGAVIGRGTSVSTGSSSSLLVTITSIASKNCDGSSSSRWTAVTKSDCWARVRAT